MDILILILRIGLAGPVNVARSLQTLRAFAQFAVPILIRIICNKRLQVPAIQVLQVPKHQSKN